MQVYTSQSHFFYIFSPPSPPVAACGLNPAVSSQSITLTGSLPMRADILQTIYILCDLVL